MPDKRPEQEIAEQLTNLSPYEWDRLAAIRKSFPDLNPQTDVADCVMDLATETEGVVGVLEFGAFATRADFRRTQATHAALSSYSSLMAQLINTVSLLYRADGMQSDVDLFRGNLAVSRGLMLDNVDRGYYPGSRYSGQILVVNAVIQMYEQEAEQHVNYMHQRPAYPSI